MPSAERGAAGHIIVIDNEPLLFDSGPGTLYRLLNAGFDYKSLNHLFYTHTHPDHISDLIPLIQGLRITPGYHRKEKLTLYGPEGLSEFLNILAQAYGSWILEPYHPFEIRELSRDELRFRGWTIKTRPMQHSRLAIAYRIETGHGRSIVYSGDTDYCTEIIELAQNADILVLECSFPDEKKVPGHLTPSEAATIAAEAGCSHLVLVHLYPPYPVLINEISNKCHQIFGGKISIAHDNMKITVES